MEAPNSLTEILGGLCTLEALLGDLYFAEREYIKKATLACIFCFCSAFPLPGADVVFGTVKGVVRDPDGAVIPGAAILIQRWELARGHTRTAINGPQVYADSVGGFRVQLTPGLYDIFVTYPGFSPIARPVQVKSAKQTNLNFELPFSPFMKLIQ